VINPMVSQFQSSSICNSCATVSTTSSIATWTDQQSLRSSEQMFVLYDNFTKTLPTSIKSTVSNAEVMKKKTKIAMLLRKSVCLRLLHTILACASDKHKRQELLCFLWKTFEFTVSKHNFVKFCKFYEECKNYDEGNKKLFFKSKKKQ